jgi:hypothetical protein
VDLQEVDPKEELHQERESSSTCIFVLEIQTETGTSYPGGVESPHSLGLSTSTKVIIHGDKKTNFGP